MPSKKLVIIVVAALLSVGVGFLVTYGYVHKGPDGYYDYDLEYADSFTSEQGVEVFPSAGKTFVIADIVLKNESFEPGINTNPLILAWRLTLDHMKFEIDSIHTFSHPDFISMILKEGRTWGYTVVYEVPTECVGKKDASIDFVYSALGDKPNIQLDNELRLRS